MSYWYLATPYSKYPAGIEAAFQMASREAARFAANGIAVYSPIAHTHPIAIAGGLDPLDHNIWLPFDGPMMQAARGLIVVKAATWEQSYGIGKEIEAFQVAGKPIIYMTPGALPALPEATNG